VLPKSTPAPALAIVEQVENAGVSAWKVAASKIVVFGAGGAGGNAVSRMIDQPTENFEGIRFCVANTDLQALNKIDCELRLPRRRLVLS
jgi:cell division GTPase FtsZ